ncbi:hypothetical protein NKJ16_10420 [Mesorhizobium sp. M0179]|uniref:hypothetical protein n=1 Tax=unclassified Mesorhizobium TaxID=325217 RepID=UPI0012EB296F|nr:hypothetical protein [Mesorhizobium sp. LSJC265A00]
MVTEDKQYEYIGSVIANRLEYTRDALKLYIQTLTVIVGGSIWLSRESLPMASRAKYAFLASALVWLVFIVTGVMVFEALRSWYNYRKVMAKFNVGSDGIPQPSFPILGAETAMLIVMFVSTILFSIYNPFYQ